MSVSIRLARAFRALAMFAAGTGAACVHGAWAAETRAASTPAPAVAVDNSNLDAPLFYELLIGEMQLRQGEASGAYEVMLDAARRTHDEQLYRRATDIALEAHAGEQALGAARAWRAALPQSIEAHRYIVQILIALNRSLEASEPLQSLIALTPLPERPQMIAALPRFFTRGSERKQAGPLFEQALTPQLNAAKPVRVASLVTLGRGWLMADDADKALAYDKRAYDEDPSAEAPAVLALEMFPTAPGAEAIVQGYVAANPSASAVRLGYARLLAGLQRYGDAVTQLDAVTRSNPSAPGPWLTLGALHIELHQPKEAEAALQEYVRLAQAAPETPAPAAGDDDDAPPASNEGLIQAWLMLAQATEMRGDYAASEQWLAKVDSPQRALDVQTRRATLLARQGKVKEARELIRRTPGDTPDDVRARLLAEAQVLREVHQWGDANAVLAKANELFPDDPDLLYEQSMMAEKLDKLDEMERLLRKVIAIKPDYHHAYNALGYSLAERGQRLPEAKALIQKALSLMPGEPFVTDSLGWVEYRMGNRSEAIRLLRQAYASRPDTEIGAHLGEVLWVDGQHDEARRVWGEARTRDGSNDVLRETLARLRVDL